MYMYKSMWDDRDLNLTRIENTVFMNLYIFGDIEVQSLIWLFLCVCNGQQWG